MRGPSRRRVVQRLSACCLALGAGRHRAAADQTPVGAPILGAIRWDAWYDPDGQVGQAVEDSLAPPAFQSRMPFFGVRSAGGRLVIDGNHQDIMDAEIRFAAFARIDYWAYCWYPTDSALQNGWKLHQSSAIRDRVNWCMLWQFSNLGGPKGFAASMPAYVGWFAQANYQRVLAGRPVVFLYLDQIDVVDKDWGGDWSAVGRGLGDLRSACARQAVAPPYVVVMGGLPEQAADLMRQIGADAISNYISIVPHEKAGPYADLDTATRQYWADLARTRSAIVPIAMTGWDQRPRKLHPPYFWHASRGDEDPAFYIRHGTAAAIAGHIRAALDFVTDHPASCPSKLVIVYSWNECDEGGSALVPTRQDEAIDTSLIDALHARP